MIAKPGDTIIVTDPSFNELYGNEYTVGGIGYSEYIWTTESGKNETFWLIPGCYQVLEEDGAEIEVDDRVVCTNRNRPLLYGKVFYVLEVYQNHSIMVDNGLITSCHNCRILKRSSEVPSSSCSDCRGTRKIQLFTSTVKCSCTTQKG